MGQCPNMTKMELINLFNLTDRPFVNVHITCNSTAATRQQVARCSGAAWLFSGPKGNDLLPLGFLTANVKRCHLDLKRRT